MTSNGGFKPATKLESKARIALAGPSGSGKTWTSLAIASELGGSIALLDTERGSASKYSDVYRFDTMQVHTFNPADIPGIIQQAAAYDTLIIDSFSHYWSGPGGMLEQVDAAGKRGYKGNNFAGWKDMRPVEKAAIDAILAFSGHVIVTMRSKTEWQVETSQGNKAAPVKVGTTPDQRNDIEYEFDVMATMDDSNTLVITKTRCPELNKAVIKEPTGQDIAGPITKWLTTNAVPDTTVADFVSQIRDRSKSVDELREIYNHVRSVGLLNATVDDEEGVSTLGELIRNEGTARARHDAANNAAEQRNEELPA